MSTDRPTVLCRVCTVPTAPETSWNVFDCQVAAEGYSLAQLISLVGGIEVRPEEAGLSSWCCSPCQLDVGIAYRVRVLCQESDRKLRKMLLEDAGVMEPVQETQAFENGTDVKIEVEESTIRSPEAEKEDKRAESANIYSQSHPVCKIEVVDPQISGPAADPLSRSQGTMSDSDSDSDCPMDCDAAADAGMDGLLPEKSKPLYELAFKRFQDWQTKQQVLTVDEKGLMAYFSQELGDKKPSTKWSVYSMLRTMIHLRMGVNIAGFVNLKSLLKRKSDGYCPKKSKILTKEQIFRFLKEADDTIYLCLKVALIVGVYGACRREEILKMTLDDVEDLEDSIRITIPNTKTKGMRQFIVTKGTDPEVDMLKLFRTYAEKRAAGTNHSRFFVSYRYGKCTKQAVGINTIAKMPKLIAEYLELPSPELYTGHCFRRSSDSLLQADSGLDISVLKRYGGGSSNAPDRRTETVFVNPPPADIICKAEYD